MEVERSAKESRESWYDKNGNIRSGGLRTAALFMGPIVLVVSICCALLVAGVIDEQTMGQLVSAYPW